MCLSAGVQLGLLMLTIVLVCCLVCVPCCVFLCFEDEFEDMTGKETINLQNNNGQRCIYGRGVV